MPSLLDLGPNTENVGNNISLTDHALFIFITRH